MKNGVTTREAAEAYGFDVSRNGMALCPFHGDRHPSMKVDERYHCFACGEDGDVIDFAAGLFGLRPIDAAKKLASDFGIPVDDTANYTPPTRREPAVTQGEISRIFAVLTDYINMLEDWQKQFAPESPESPPDPRFTRAVTSLEQLRYYQNTLTNSSRDEQKSAAVKLKEVINEFTRELDKYRSENKESTVG